MQIANHGIVWSSSCLKLQNEDLDISDLNTKQAQFNAAMARFNSQKRFAWTGNLVATSSVIMQLLLLYRLWEVEIGFVAQVLVFILAYVLTDFLNGLIHLLMDHHERYDSFYGPLVAHFHLHHQTPRYTKKPLLSVYFHETGAKLWLVPFLLMALVFRDGFSPLAFHTLVYIGILSSVAEVSHYLCHTSMSRTALFLARKRILLSKKHHAPHHAADNMNYAFLNGISDPLINVIAEKFFRGYKQTTDLHFSGYTSGAEASQR